VIDVTFLLTRSARTVVAVASAGILTAMLPVSAATSAEEATIYVIQGLPDQVVDVSVDGETVAEDVASADVVGPFSVAAGGTEVRFTDADGAVVADNTVTTRPDSSSDLVVHLPTAAAEDTVVTVFDNDLSAVPADKAALTVAHTAAVPPADILVNGEVLFANVANGESLDLVVPVDTYEVQIVPTGETEPVILDLKVQGGALNRVYAVGNPESKSMNVAVHVIDVDDSGSPEPEMVNTGTGGQAALLLRLLAILSALLR
jgi:hypothetical protein